MVETNFINGDSPSEFIFDKALLEGLDLKPYDDIFKQPEYDYLKPAEDLIVRPLACDDINKGFIDVLGQLTSVGTITHRTFLERFKGMKATGMYYLVVIEDVEAKEGSGKIIATATLIAEQKLFQDSLCGRIEDVVVNKTYRGKKLGKVLMATLVMLSKKIGCCKTTLECKDENIPFYKKFQFEWEGEKYLVQRFRN